MPEDEAPKTANVQHRGKLYQVHVAPRGGDESDNPKPHVHIQDEDGGPGQVLPLDHPVAREFARHHESIRDLGAEHEDDKKARTEKAGASQRRPVNEQQRDDRDQAEPFVARGVVERGDDGPEF